MLFGITILAPAKVNIGLKVYPKRKDGYHAIESVFQTVSLYDELDVKIVNQDNVCLINCDQMVLPAENTISNTYKAFCLYTGIKSGVSVNLKKMIPHGGGLGGGSSDAASFLKALTLLFNVQLTDQLADFVASKVGSDVFFFLHCGEFTQKNGCAIVSGRGEIVKAIEPRNDLFFVLVFPDVHSSTKEAYVLIDKAYEIGNTVACPEYNELQSIYKSSVKDWSYKNSFTSVLVNEYPVIGEALEDIRRSGAIWADMSGSGATVFGIFDSAKKADHAIAMLQTKWKNCVLAH